MRSAAGLSSVLTLVSILGCYHNNRISPPAIAETSSSVPSLAEAAAHGEPPYRLWENYLFNRFAVVFVPSDSHYLRLGKVIYVDIHDGGTESTKYADGRHGECVRFPRCISYDLPPEGSGDLARLLTDCAAVKECSLEVIKQDYTALTGKPAPF